MTLSTTTRPAHKYDTIGTTYARPRDCTATGYLVEYSPSTTRIRITYVTSWQGGREKIWYLDGQTEEAAQALLAELTTDYDAQYSLGTPDRIGPVIR